MDELIRLRRLAEDERDAAIKERDELRDALSALVAHLRSPDIGAFEVMAQLHGARPTNEQLAEHRRIWARVDALLGHLDA